MKAINEIIQGLPYTVVTIIITAIISLSAKKVGEAIVLLFRILTNEGKTLRGQWYLYLYCGAKDDYVFNESVMKFKLSLSFKLKYAVESVDSIMYSSKDLSQKNVFEDKYKGYLQREGTFLNLCLHSLKKEYYDATFHKFRYTSLDDNSFFVGIYASSDYDTKPCCGVSILSKAQLTKVKVDELIRRNYSRKNNWISAT